VKKRTSQIVRYVNLVKNVANWWLYPAVKFGLIRKFPVLFRLRNGVRIELPQQSFNVFKEIVMDDCYLKGLPEKPQEPSLTILDIGANVGCFSLFMASKYPEARIFAFEPMAKNFEMLKKNAGINASKQLSCISKAVFGHSGTLKLQYIPQEDFPTRASVFKYQSFWDSIDVPCISLSDIFQQNDIRQVDLLKLDCEGAEYDILYQLPENSFSILIFRSRSAAPEKEESRSCLSTASDLKEDIRSLQFWH